MRRRSRLLYAAAAAAFALPALTGQAWAQDAGWGEGVEIMDDADLAGHRGGFEINGIEINFGAVITTYVNGVPALTTQLTWTDVGAMIQQTVGAIGESIEEMTPDQLEALGIDASANGVVIADENGVTTLVHNVTEGVLQNIIINNASGRDLSQEIDVTLELPGFEAMQASLLVESFGIHLMDDMRGVMFYDPGG